jgi:hypothetical protein
LVIPNFYAAAPAPGLCNETGQAPLHEALLGTFGVKEQGVGKGEIWIVQ